MNTSFYNGVSGLKTYQAGINVWGDNIANVNTTGYKAKNIDFKTLFSQGDISGYGNTLTNNSPIVQNDVGLGVAESVTYTDTKQGNIKKTDNAFDVAIQGDGFFKVRGANNENLYTRAGTFVKDATGTLLNINGEKVLGIDAKTLKKEGDKWTFDANVDTSNVFSDTTNVTPLVVPESITFPAQATKKVSLSGNLNNGELADNVKPVKNDSDFGVLYNIDKENMNIKNGQNLVFGFGNNIKYENGLVKIDNCIADDEADGKDVNIDFNVNDVNIKVKLPDGSTKNEIINAVAKELDKNNILYDKTDSGIMLKSHDKLKIKKNSGEFFPDASAEVLTYNSKPDISKGEFKTVTDFKNELQNLANDVYPNTTKVDIDEQGKFYIENNSDVPINAISLKANNTNEKFLENLGRLGNEINSHTASNSLVFNHDYKGFSGDIIDSKGNKDSLDFNFTKIKVKNSLTTWNGLITETSPDGKIISKQNKEFIFNDSGALISPKTVTIDNNGTPTDVEFGGDFSGLTSFSQENMGFEYSQDGLSNGELTKYDIDENGKIIASFSNGKDGVIGAIPLFHFQNEQGLDNIGYQDFIETPNSGKAFTYVDGEGKYMLGAKIKNYALETSNVSMSEALTQMIIMQKAFNSNSKAVTTSDQMIQKAIDMKK